MDDPRSHLPARPQERLLIEALEDDEVRQVLCTSLGRAQLACAAAHRFSSAHVDCLYFDLHHAHLARAAVGEVPNLAIHCAADFAEVVADLVLLPLSASGEGELTREFVQSAHQTLRVGGRLLASSDNPRDTWLDQVLRKNFTRVQRQANERGVVYSATKTEPLAKVKDFCCEVVFRDRETLMRGFSRPGVFSHRRVDPGARRLMAAMEIGRAHRVIDIGCGWGSLALAAAARGESVFVEAIDSNARAVDCLRHAAERACWHRRILPRLTASGDCSEPGSFDLALANPPYFADFRIAELFVTTAHLALRKRGTLLVVTKMPEWYLYHLPVQFCDVQATESKGYYVIRAEK